MTTTPSRITQPCSSVLKLSCSAAGEQERHGAGGGRGGAGVSSATCSGARECAAGGRAGGRAGSGSGAGTAGTWYCRWLRCSPCKTCRCPPPRTAHPPPQTQPPRKGKSWTLAYLDALCVDDLAELADARVLVHDGALDVRALAHPQGQAVGVRLALLELLVVVGAHQNRIHNRHISSNLAPQANHRILDD